MEVGRKQRYREGKQPSKKGGGQQVSWPARANARGPFRICFEICWHRGGAHKQTHCLLLKGGNGGRRRSPGSSSQTNLTGGSGADFATAWAANRAQAQVGGRASRKSVRKTEQGEASAAARKVKINTTLATAEEPKSDVRYV